MVDFLYEKDIFAQTFEKPDDYSELIEVVLEDLGVKYENRGKYYLLQNPLVDEDNKMSAQWWIDDGNFKSYNCAIEVTRAGKATTDTSLSLTEFVRASGRFDLYVDFILSSNYIKRSDLFAYKDAIIDYTLFKKWSRVVDKYRKIFFSVYITDKDVLSYQSDREIKTFTRFYKKDAVEEQKKKAIELFEPAEFYKIKCRNYLSKRKIMITDSIYPIMVKTQNNQHGMPAICISYPNGFKKLRLLEGSLRYITDVSEAKYSMLYPARHKGTERCYVIEGEFESQVYTHYTSDDVFALHNTSSVPKSMQLENYKEIIIRIDFDRFEENYAHVLEKIKEISPFANVIIEPKIQLLTDEGKKMYDYNDLHVMGELKNFLKNPEETLEKIKVLDKK
ncbi:MAG: hypothetical protein ACRDD8_05235 [Bacteroidales bacterium]